MRLIPTGQTEAHLFAAVELSQTWIAGFERDAILTELAGSARQFLLLFFLRFYLKTFASNKKTKVWYIFQ